MAEQDVAIEELKRTIGEQQKQASAKVEGEVAALRQRIEQEKARASKATRELEELQASSDEAVATAQKEIEKVREALRRLI